jgi:hypothetical protein
MSGVEILENGMLTGVEIGDILAGWYCSAGADAMRYFGGQSLPAFSRDVERDHDFLRKTTRVAYAFIVDTMIVYRQLAQALRGLTAGLSSLTGEGFDEGDFEENRDRSHKPLAVCWYHIMKCQLHVYAREWAQAVADGARALPALWMVRHFPNFPEFHYFYALALAANYFQVSATEQEQYRAVLTQHEAKLRLWAKSCPENFSGKHALVAAEIARIDCKPSDATQLYNAAIHGARRGGLVQVEALAYETAARFHRASLRSVSARGALLLCALERGRQGQAPRRAPSRAGTAERA